MHDAQRSRRFRRIVVYSIATVLFMGLIVGLLYGLQPMLLPFVLGAFLAYLFKPVVRSFRGSQASKYARAFVLLMFIGSIFYWGGLLVKSSLPNANEKLSLKVRLQYRLNERYQSWMGLKNNAKGNLIYQKFGAELDPLKQKATEYVRLSNEERKQFLLDYQANAESANADEAADKNTDKNADPVKEKYYNYYLANLAAQKVDLEKLKAAAKANPAIAATISNPEAAKETGALASLMNTFSHWLIFPLAFIFLLLDKGQIMHFFMGLIPNRYFELIYTVIENVDDALGKYIRGTMIECLLVGVTLIIGFYICGIDLKVAIAIGALGGLTNAIPFVGTFIACIVGAAYSLIAENIQPIIPFINEDNLMIAVIAVVMIAHLLDNAIYQPLVVGSAVNIHPLVVITGVFGGSMMFGFAGLIFAIPTIVILKVVTQTLFTGLKEYRII
jgi:predicted PurR-regulated permease PerM